MNNNSPINNSPINMGGGNNMLEYMKSQLMTIVMMKSAKLQIKNENTR